MDFNKFYNATLGRPFFKDVKRNWKVFYYMYDLTEPVTETYVTEFLAVVRGYWISMRTGFRVYVSEI